jgi:hypothetical protein
VYDKKSDRWQRQFRYPLRQRLLFVVALLLVAGVLLAYNWDRVGDIGPIFRAKLKLEERPRMAWAALGALVVFTAWAFYVSFRAWMTRIIISPSSIKLHIVFHGRQRVSWEHATEVEYKWRLFGHTLILYGSDGGSVHFRSSIRGYDELIALIHHYAPAVIREQFEELLAPEEYEDYAEEREEEFDEDEGADDPEGGEEAAGEDDDGEDASEAGAAGDAEADSDEEDAPPQQS